MKKTEYKLKDRYDYKKYRTDRSKDEEYTKLVTVPGQSISIRELVERYETGRPIPGGLYEEPGELGELKNARFEDADYQQDMRVDPLTGMDAIKAEAKSLQDSKKQRETDKKIKALEKAELEAKKAKDKPLESPEKEAL